LLPAFAVLLLLSFALPTFAQDQPTHTVQPGENLFRIALNYGLTTEQLAAANNIANAWQIYSGQVLVIPAAGQPAAPAADPALDPNLPALEPASAATTTYTVQRGDNLASIARRFGMSVEQVASLNNLANPNLLFAGQVLTVNGVAEPAPAPAPVVDPAPAPPPAAPTTQTIHVVQPGEYLSAIARRYGVSYLAIAQANNIFDANTVFSGQRLIIPAPGTVPDAAVQAVPAAPAPIVGVGREIVVDLSDSRAYAYENGVLLRNVLGSMGRSVTPTVVGSFSIQRKYVSSPMTGPGYYLPDVPYAMYFYQGYAIHGTYWHSNWGVPMSHGCVNLPTPEAEWFFSFADIGTPVNVQY
jgi:LysM repeat protein